MRVESNNISSPTRVSRKPIIIAAVTFGFFLSNIWNFFGHGWEKYRAHADFSLAYDALRRGDEIAAAFYFDQGLKKDPDNQHASQQLRELLNDRGLPTNNSEPQTSPDAAHIIHLIHVERASPSKKYSDTIEVDSLWNENIITKPLKAKENKLHDKDGNRVYRFPDDFNDPYIETPPKQDTHAINQLGFQALSDGRQEDAIAAFTESLRRDAEQSLILRQLGYIYKSRGQESDAATAFQKALNLGGMDRKTRRTIKREVDTITDRFNIRAYSINRGSTDINLQQAAAGPSLRQSQLSFEADYRPFLSDSLNKYHLNGFTRIIGSYFPNTYILDSDSYQAGLGIRAKPYPKENLFLTAERLVAVGNNARNDWLLRATWSKGAGYAQPEGKRNWLLWSLYADAAVIDPIHPDFLGTVEARVGQSFLLNGFSDFVVTPYVGLNGLLQDAGPTTTLLEAGLGIQLELEIPSLLFSGSSNQIDLRTEYRQKLAGNSFSDSGLLFSVGLNF